MHSKLHKLHTTLTHMHADSHISKHHVVIAKGDSGATNHYWRTKDAHILENIKTHIY